MGLPLARRRGNKAAAATPLLAPDDGIARNMHHVAPNLAREPIATLPDNLSAGDNTTAIGAEGPVSRDAKRAQEDAKRAARVATIVADSEDPHGTPVELYLRHRGITKTPLPPSIRHLPNADNHYGALVALATDDTGQVHGLQLIYLTAAGRKAPLKIQKRTNKTHDRWSSVSAVRLRGSPPIVLCEGVETALSVWQAIGQETWACLGISNIACAPVPEEAPVIIARDGDELNSKADQQIRRAVTSLVSQGHHVTVAQPPLGQDFNDVLQRDGDDGVGMLFAATRPAVVFSNAWRKDLLLNEDQEPRPVLANAITALRGAPDWDGVLWHDAFATTTVARKAPPWIDRPMPWSDMGAVPGRGRLCLAWRTARRHGGRQSGRLRLRHPRPDHLGQGAPGDGPRPLSLAA